MPKLVQIFANSSNSPGGAERVLGQISEVARDRGYQVTELCEADFRLRDWTHRWTMLNLPWRIWQMNHLARRVIKEADVVISHGLYGAFIRHSTHIYVLHSTFAGMAEAMKTHVPRLDFWISRYVWGQFLERKNCYRATNVSVSSFVAEEAKRYYGVRPEVIANSCSWAPQDSAQERFALRTRLGLPTTGKLILVVGRREKLKGWPLIKLLASSLPVNTCIIWVGRGETLDSPTLKTVGPVRVEELKDYYRACDWLLSPSLYEGFGLTLLEAWSVGTPVLTTPTGLACGLRGEEPSFDACLADQTDSLDALRQILDRALTQPELGSQQVAWAQRSVLPHYNPRVFADQWGQLLSKVATRT